MYEKRLVELGLTLPAAAVPSFNYVPVTMTRRRGVAGQLPKVGEDVLATKVGAGVSLAVARGERGLHAAGPACLRQALERSTG
jgi:hypothetical protein